MTPQEIAERSAHALLENDAASQSLGMRLVTVAEGRAVMEMTTGAAHLNGHGICHGGVIFSLADTAFAVACNSRNQRVVAQQNQITFLAPGHPGETLTATATELSQAGRSGVYDIVVTGADDRQIAVMRGLSRSLRGHHFDPNTAGDSDARSDAPT